MRSSRKTKAAVEPRLEGLEVRQVLSTTPDIAVLGTFQKDSHDVVVRYEVKDQALESPLTIKVDRSASSAPNSAATNIGSTVIRPTDAGASIGVHEVTIPVGDGLAINPSRPFIVAKANTDQSIVESNASNNAASYRIFTIGVISHGGKQPGKWGDKGPPWENKMARSLQSEGYDFVIPFNWVKSSSTPGSAKGVASYLTKKVTDTAAGIPGGSAIALHFIGHSEGSVVNSQVLTQLAANMPANLAPSYIKETMLDPHAASNNFTGPQYSVAGNPMGAYAASEIKKYQTRARDPLVTVPAIVDSAEVFYQHTPANRAQSNGGLYNLWGQVPIQGLANYYDITNDGVSHAGKYGVFDWYQQHVVPTLGEGAGTVAAQTVSMQLLPAKGNNGITTLVGQAPAGSKVTVKQLNGVMLPGFGTGVTQPKVLGSTVAGSNGAWSVDVQGSPSYPTSFVAWAKPSPKSAGGLPMIPKAIVSAPLF